MFLNLENLSCNAIGKIFNFLNEQSIGRLRQTGKAILDLVDAVICSRKTIVSDFSIFEFTENSIEITIKIDYPRHLRYWATRFMTIVTRIGVTGLVEDDRFASRPYRMQISASVTPDKLEKVFDYLLPLINKTEFIYISVDSDSSEIVTLCANVFACQSVLILDVDINRPEPPVLKSYLELIEKVNPSSQCFLYLNDFSEAFLLFLQQAAKVATNLYITSENEIPQLKIQLIHAILSQKCEFLQFEPALILSIDDIANLIQLFHHSTKKVYLGARTQAGLIATQIGAYSIASYTFNNGFLDLAITNLK